jgi:exopolysaccharide biosynthesis polyprenyl glycosylphosphotransferase
MLLAMNTRSTLMRYPWLPYFLTDFLSIIVAYYLAILFRFRSAMGHALYDRVTLLLLEQPAGKAGYAFERFYYESAFRIILILAAVICLLYALRHLYAGRRFILRRSETWNIFVCNVIALAIFYFYWYLTRNTYHPRSLFASLIVLNILLCPVFRMIMGAVLRRVRKKWGMDCCAALLVGAGRETEILYELLHVREPHGIFCRSRLSAAGIKPFPERLAEIQAIIDTCNIDMLIVADPGLSVPQIMQVMELTAKIGIPVKILSARLDVLVKEAHLPCDILQGVPLAHFNAPARGGHLGVVRRGLTVLWATLLLGLSTPLLLLLAVLIRVTSPGAVIFRQKRIGINRKPFYIYKFRTMRHMAEEALPAIEAENESGGALFKIRQDPRVTPVGRFLRRFSLDELPQLMNVVKGDMAIVGPRPLPERDFQQYEEDWHYIRHGGLPGLTCLWQISGRSDLDFHQMCILDIYYLRNHTWIMDLSIALQTFRIVLFGIGAY